MSSKESYEYVEPHIRYWLLVGVGFFVQGLHALSKFRDGTFQRHTEAAERKEQEDAGTRTTTVSERVTVESKIPATGTRPAAPSE